MAGFRIIAGLGNPGSEYQFTRHNIGFMSLDLFERELSGGKVERASLLSRGFDQKGEALIAQSTIEGEKVWLIKPTCFMNLSGGPIAELMRFYKIAPSEIVVVHDDIDLPLGAIRIKVGGGDGGHNGIKSIVSCTGSADFVRLKLGVGRPQAATAQGTLEAAVDSQKGATRDVASWVLGRFGKQEEPVLTEQLALASSAILLLLRKGVKDAQNKCTRR